MQAVVERLDLGPQPVQLGGEVVGVHVVVGPPQRAGVGVAELLGALVHQLDQPGVVVAHGRRDGPPAGPGRRQRFGVARAGDDVEQVAQALTRAAVGGAERAAPVGALQPGRDLGELGRLGGVGRGGQRDAGAQHAQLAVDVVGQVEPVVAGGLGGEVRRGGDQPLVGLGGQDLGVGRDVGGLDPGGARGLDAQVAQDGLGRVHERDRVLDGRRRGDGRGRRRDRRRRGQPGAGAAREPEGDSERDESGGGAHKGTGGWTCPETYAGPDPLHAFSGAVAPGRTRPGATRNVPSRALESTGTCGANARPCPRPRRCARSCLSPCWRSSPAPRRTPPLGRARRAGRGARPRAPPARRGRHPLSDSDLRAYDRDVIEEPADADRRAWAGRSTGWTPPWSTWTRRISTTTAS